MQQAVQEVKNAKDAEYQALSIKHEELAALVASLQESVSAQNSSNSVTLQVCHLSHDTRCSKADLQAVQKCWMVFESLWVP